MIETPAARLPDAAWTRRPDLAGLHAALGAGQARYVGGAVRDSLLGEAATDVDMATPLAPPAVIMRLEAAGIRAVPTGLAHGTVTAVLTGGPVEITTLREDIATDGRRATVAFAADWRADAARRDFTINALYADPVSRELFDYFGGLGDLAARRVRFIGDPHQRIIEDHLRILRYFRFQSRFGSQPADKQAEQACRDLAPTLKGLSRERIGMELIKLLALADPAPTITRMAVLGVLAQVLPEAVPDRLAPLVAAEVKAAISGDPIRRLAALLPADPVIAEQVGARLRLANAGRKRLVSAALRGEPAADPRALAYRIGHQRAVDRLLLSGRPVDALVGWSPPRFPLKGGDVVARGVTAGPQVARLLHRIEERWIAEGFPGGGRAEALLAEELAT